MIAIVITLIAVSVVLFIISFFMTDKFDRLESQYEQLSISTMQDTYQIKKQLKILEEELLTDRKVKEDVTSTEKQPPLIQQVYDLHQRGYSISEIAEKTRLDTYDVQAIINNSK